MDPQPLAEGRNPDLARAILRDRGDGNAGHLDEFDLALLHPRKPALGADPQRPRPVLVKAPDQVVGQPRSGCAAIVDKTDAVEARQSAVGADPQVPVVRLQQHAHAVVRQARLDVISLITIRRIGPRGFRSGDLGAGKSRDRRHRHRHPAPETAPYTAQRGRVGRLDHPLGRVEVVEHGMIF